MKLAEALIASGNCSTMEEAKAEIKNGQTELLYLIDEDEAGIIELGDFCMNRWGLEPDYLMELIS